MPSESTPRRDDPAPYPSAASITSTQISARVIVLSARITEKTSTELECLLRGRIPAVSMKRYCLPVTFVLDVDGIPCCARDFAYDCAPIPRAMH